MIEKYSFGKIVVNGAVYTDDIKIVQGAVIPGWWRKSGHRVDIDDIEDMLDSETTILVIGTGKFGLMKSVASLREFLTDAGIQLIEKNTSDSAKIFNQLYEAGKNVAAGFHLTC